MSNTLDLLGQRFGSLVVIKDNGSRYGQRLWSCLCDCGVAKDIVAYSLRAGLSHSCGCARAKYYGEARITHNGTGTPMYRLWSGMKTRCSNHSRASYKNYGGRGIKVCERWMKFENFLADMGERPPGLTIERINNDGNYEPSNCRWATTQEQARNRRTTVLVNWRGRDCTIPEVAKSCGVSYRKLYRLIVNKNTPAHCAVESLQRSKAISAAAVFTLI